MEKPITSYIALGSNTGNRLTYLQNALDLIDKRLGNIEAISPVYQTPSWGFSGNDFLNACIRISTRLSADNLLKQLLQIEKESGRERNSDTYQNRSLDLDILFYENQLIKTENLTVPHPQIEKRRFVLQPLADIAGDFIHPVSGLNIAQLLTGTEDTSEVNLFPQELKKPETTDFSQLSYLAIEGNIGSGKTSLSSMIAQDFNAKLIHERFKDNAFLPKFYENKARYAFPLEMSFLADRYQQLLDDIGQFDLFKDLVVADYDIYKSMIFAGVTLAPEEFSLYKKLFGIMYKDLPKPDLYIYLYQSTERLLQNIKKRGRSYEQQIPAEYLENINRGYLDFIKNQNHLKVEIIDITDLDFVNYRKDYLFVLDKVQSALKKK